MAALDGGKPAPAPAYGANWTARLTVVAVAVAAAASLGLGAAPGRADARPASAGPCGCMRPWAMRMFRDPFANAAFNQSFLQGAASLGPAKAAARLRQVRPKLYDWAKEGWFKESYCERHPKVCKAIAACAAAGSQW